MIVYTKSNTSQKKWNRIITKETINKDKDKLLTNSTRKLIMFKDICCSRKCSITSAEYGCIVCHFSDIVWLFDKIFSRGRDNVMATNLFFNSSSETLFHTSKFGIGVIWHRNYVLWLQPAWESCYNIYQCSRVTWIECCVN